MGWCAIYNVITPTHGIWMKNYPFDVAEITLKNGVIR